MYYVVHPYINTMFPIVVNECYIHLTTTRTTSLVHSNTCKVLNIRDILSLFNSMSDSLDENRK